MPTLDDDGALADLVAAAVEACPSVARLEPEGAGAAVATHLPGRRVDGVRLTDDGVEVNVVARWGLPMPVVAEQVRAAVRSVVAHRPVAVDIADIEVPTAARPGSEPADAPP